MNVRVRENNQVCILDCTEAQRRTTNALAASSFFFTAL